MNLTHDTLIADAINDVLEFRVDNLRLYGLARHVRAKRILEMGVETGCSTRALMLALEENGGGILVSIDIDSTCAAALSGHKMWTFICADSTRGETAEMARNIYDLIFIDSSHEYEQTRKEIGLYVPMLAIGGIVVFHDTKAWMPGVRIPINEFLESNNGWKYFEYAESRNGLGVLSRERGEGK